MPQLAPYLNDCAVIDWQHPAIMAQARLLASDAPATTVLQCFQFVRDQIEHSVDFQRDTITIKASDVLKLGSGLCFSKSHLLVALLRANGIAAGLCYQRLKWRGAESAFCLHGLVAVWLAAFAAEPCLGWTRCDPRGNTRHGVNAQWVAGQDNLAFSHNHASEQLYDGIWAQPWPELITQLQCMQSVTAYCAAPLDLPPPVDDVNRLI